MTDKNIIFYGRRYCLTSLFLLLSKNNVAHPYRENEHNIIVKDARI